MNRNIVRSKCRKPKGMRTKDWFERNQKGADKKRMKVLKKRASDGKLVKRVTLDLQMLRSATIGDGQYPTIIPDEHGMLLHITGTEDQFKCLIAAIIRDVESDRDDILTEHYKEKQPCVIICNR